MLDDAVFSRHETERFRDYASIRHYATITKRQAAGLLGALGEHAGRVAPPEYLVDHPPWSTSADAQEVQARSDLVSFCALWKRPETGEPWAHGVRGAIEGC